MRVVVDVQTEETILLVTRDALRAENIGLSVMQCRQLTVEMTHEEQDTKKQTINHSLAIFRHLL